MKPLDPLSDHQEDAQLQVLRLLGENPRLSQRELAEALGVSVGKANYCLKALLGKGFIKVQNFRNSQNKLRYAYLLTPNGLVEKTGLTARFLMKKLEDYERLCAEIKMLQTEMSQESQAKKAQIR